MELPLVNRTLFTQLNQTGLVPYAQNCLGRVKDHAAYQPVQLQTTQLEEAATAYAAALAVSRSGGSDRIAIKNAAMKVLEQHAGGDPLYLPEAGMMPRRSNNKVIEELNTPETVRVRPGSTPGQAIIDFSPVPGARMYAIEWAVNDSGEWQSGHYVSSRRALLKVPARSDLRVQVRALGPKNRKSNWKVAETVFIP